MKAKLLVTFVLAALLMTTATAAAEVDSVILTTKNHYPDTIVAGVVGSQIGAPVFVTSEGLVDSEVLAEIEDLSPETVYIVGGPAVISDELEASLAEDYDVVRIWGMTRYGTAAELAEYFWESSEKAMLVWDVMGLADAGNYEMLAEARDLAIQEGMPVLLIKKNEIPEQVVDALLNLSVESVVLVGNLGDDVTDALEELGIEISDEIKGTTPEETRERIKEKIKEKLRERAQKHLVVIAAGNWSDTIKAPYLTNGSARHITNADQIDDLIAEIEDMNYTSIKIVGKPELARVIYNELADAGIDADLISARNVVSAAVQVMEKEIARIRARADAMEDKLREMYQRKVISMQSENDGIVERTEMFITNSNLGDDIKRRWLNWLSEKKESFDQNVADGNYTKAWQDHNALKKQIANITYTYRTRLADAYHSLVRHETTLQTAITNLREKVSSLRTRVADS